MRKYLIAAIAAVTAIAFAAVAFAQAPIPRRMKVKVTPTKAGTKKKPKNSDDRSRRSSNNDTKRTMAKLDDLRCRRTSSLGQGPDDVRRAELDRRAARTLPEGAELGKGTAERRRSASTATDPAPLHVRRHGLQSNARQRKNMLGFYIDGGATRVPDRDARSRRHRQVRPASCTIDVPDAAQQPAPATFTGLVSLNDDADGRRRARTYLVSTIGCKGKKHPFKADLTFIDNGVSRRPARDLGHGDRDVQEVARPSSDALCTKAPLSAGPSSFIDSVGRVAVRSRDRRPRRPADPGLLVRRRGGGRARRLVPRAGGAAGRRPRLRARRASGRCSALPLAVEVAARRARRVRRSPSPSTPAWRARTASSDNLAPTAVYVGFWVGVPFASLLFGDVFRLLSPWRAIGRGDRLARRRVGARRAARAARSTRSGSATGRPSPG